MSPDFSDNVLPFWIEKNRSGQRMCLATLVKIDGSAPRPLGSQIAISEDGSALGYITGGCAEAAIIAEAQAAIAKGENRLIRYGEGSPYKDISLPCGSGIEVYFDVELKAATVANILSALAARQQSHLQINLDDDCSEAIKGDTSISMMNNRVFTRAYLPVLKLYIFGKGPIVPALATLALQSEFVVETASPETETLILVDDHTEKKHLNSPTDYLPNSLDPWCAAVTLFHDHEWEPPILKHLLESRCFYVGALGSRATHAARLETLTDSVPAENLDQLRGPVGLDIQASTPTEIAISILAEIIQTYRMAERGPARWRR